MTASQIGRRGSLTKAVIDALSARIDNGVYGPGGKLPTEKQLCSEFGVSRTVVREAVASLRLSGVLYSRQGLGVFVQDQDVRRLNFNIEQIDDIVSAMRILELRIGVELESVALAAQRRSPEALAEITDAFDRLANMDSEDGELLASADFDFHMAIARATGNPHFAQFLEALGRDISFDLRLKHTRTAGDSKKYRKRIKQEHKVILAAIAGGDQSAARSAMRRHLQESLVRYRGVVESSKAVD